METNKLIEFDKLNKNKQLKFCKKYSVKFNIIVVFLVIIIILQSFSLFYLIIMSNIAQNLHLYEFNKTKLSDYATKFESIIDYLCGNVLSCY